MTERYTGRRTPEEDGLIVWGVDPQSIGAWPDYIDREFRDPALPPELVKTDAEEEKPDGEMLDGLIKKYLDDQDDRILVGLFSMGKPLSAIEGIFAACGGDMPKEKGRRRLARCVRILHAAYKVEVARRAVGKHGARLTETECTVWAMYRARAAISDIAITIDRGKRYTLELVAATCDAMRSAGYSDYVDAIKDLRNASALGNKSKVNSNGGRKDGPQATPDRGDVAAAS